LNNFFKKIDKKIIIQLFKNLVINLYHIDKLKVNKLYKIINSYFLTLIKKDLYNKLIIIKFHKKLINHNKL
jgi:hypothetical protein